MSNKTAFKLQNHELAGIDLAGWKQPSGVIKLLDSGRYIDEWPEVIPLLGNEFTLEDVERGKINPETGEIYENAIYV